MKRLFLVRHAKSDWPEDMQDFDRPLATRGIDDAHLVAKHLKDKGLTLDKLVSSPAVRALQTAEIFNQEFDLDLSTDEKLYHPTEDNFLSVIYDLDDDLDSVALFSHNNGISNFANYIAHEAFHFPTCGVAGFEVQCDSWSEFESSPKKLFYTCEPKKI